MKPKHIIITVAGILSSLAIIYAFKDKLFGLDAKSKQSGGVDITLTPQKANDYAKKIEKQLANPNEFYNPTANELIMALNKSNYKYENGKAIKII